MHCISNSNSNGNNNKKKKKILVYFIVSKIFFKNLPIVFSIKQIKK